jgi:hypothetical protein
MLDKKMFREENEDPFFVKVKTFLAKNIGLF